jgi:hypothetical protein
MSLAKLLAEKRGVKNQKAQSKLTIEQIFKWADVHHQTTGNWPTVVSGTILDALTENWRNIQNALSVGLRGLPSGSSLAKLLAEKRSAK